MLWYNLIYVSSLLIKRNWRKNEKRFFMFSTLIFLHQKLTGMSAGYGAGCEDESEKILKTLSPSQPKMFVD